MMVARTNSASAIYLRMGIIPSPDRRLECQECLDHYPMDAIILTEVGRLQCICCVEKNKLLREIQLGKLAKNNLTSALTEASETTATKQGAS